MKKIFIVLIIGAFLLFGCDGKINKDKYELFFCGNKSSVVGNNHVSSKYKWDGQDIYVITNYDDATKYMGNSVIYRELEEKIFEKQFLVILNITLGANETFVFSENHLSVSDGVLYFNVVALNKYPNGNDSPREIYMCYLVNKEIFNNIDKLSIYPLDVIENDNNLIYQEEVSIDYLLSIIGNIDGFER